MKKTILLCALTLCTLTLFAQGGKKLTFNDVMQSPMLRAEGVRGLTPIPGDGEHYAQMNREGTQVVKYS